MKNKVSNWIEARIGLKGLIDSQLREYKVPQDINVFYTLGFVTMTAYIVQALTGFFLLVYYVPHADHAFRSVQDIMTTVPYGWLFRMMHVVGSNLMVAVIALHLASVFFMGSYRKPRELTWVTGFLMLLVTLAFCLSGYLLPWSQLSYWATTIIMTMPMNLPFVGEFFANALRGGDHISGLTLGRFFALHIALLPPVIVFLMGLHIFLIRRIGISSRTESPAQSLEWKEYSPVNYIYGIPYYPGFLLKELVTVMVFFSVMFFIITFMPTLFLPEEAAVPADPFKTPIHVRPEWYFLAPYQMLKLFPNKFLGILVQSAIMGALLLWPFFDAKRKEHLVKRPLLLGTFLCALALWFVLTLWGRY